MTTLPAPPDRHPSRSTDGPPPARRRRWAAVIVLTAACLVTAGAPASARPAGSALSWTDCGDGLQCATLSVPLDYDEPRGRRITLDLRRLPATDPAHRIGSLLINAGGPGDSAEGFLRSRVDYRPEVRARFDLVGVESRGVGPSTEVRCFASAAEEAAFAADYPQSVPVGAAEERRAARKSRELADRCWARNAWLLPHLSTANVARDLDRVRAAVGDDRMTFAGYSYGSYVGATYANMFPDRVRALLLDGGINPEKYGPRRPGPLGSNPFLRIGSDVATGETFAQFLRLCADSPHCALSGGAGPRARFDALARKLRRHPVEVAGPAGPIRVGYGEVVTVTNLLLYAPNVWQLAAQALADLEAGDATLIAQFIVALGDPPIMEPSIAVLCSEGETPSRPEAAAVAARVADRRTPYFGRYWAYTLQVCASWRQLDADRYRGPFDRPTSAPALQVTNRYDPATPYHSAVETTRIMPGSRLLTVQGYGHTVRRVPSECARRVVADYLVAGTLPPPGATCPIDVQPFDPVGPVDLRSAIAG